MILLCIGVVPVASLAASLGPGCKLILGNECRGPILFTCSACAQRHWRRNLHGHTGDQC